jgi:fructokinase
MSRVLCLGEAVVDFVAEPRGAGLAGAHRFFPSFGGSQANVAVGAARLGTAAALAGSAGTDPWGAWLRDRLAAEGVDASLYRLRGDVETTIAFVALADDGEPEFSIWGGASEGMLTGVEERLVEVVEREQPGVIAFGSDTLIAPLDRELVEALKRAGLERGWRVLYDPNLRQGRWPDRELMLRVASDALAGVTVVKANRDEAALLTGEAEPDAAAASLTSQGARQAVVTLASSGALLANGGSVERFPAEDVVVADATGAGDSVAAVIAATLATSRAVGGDAIRLAMRIAGSVVGARGALAGFPRGARGGSPKPGRDFS